MKTKIIKSSQEQALASWIEYLRVLREENLIDKLSTQDMNLEKSLSALDEIKQFISNPEHILGSSITKHGEVAEHIQVGFSNAEQLIQGNQPTHTFDGVGRLAMEDYLQDGKMIQSKFYNGTSGTFKAVCEHFNDYPQFIREGGTYDIPKDQYEQLIDIYNRGETARYSLRRTEETLFKNMKSWETENEVSIKEVIKPAKVNYDEVQLGIADKTINAEEKQIKETDEKIREDINSAHKPTIQEGLKATVISAAVEGTFAFVLKIIKIKKSGKKLSEFTKEDWKEVGIDTAIGTGKGAIRGAVVYTMTNFTPVPSPIANALVTASLGIVAQARKLNKGKIDKEEFINNAEVLCLDVAVSALSSLVGEYLIPIPILGSIIGNTVGMFLYEISKVYLSKTEQKAVLKYKTDYENFVLSLDKEYQEFIQKINAELSLFNSMIALAFDENINTRFFVSINLAKSLNIDDNKILKSKKEIDDFFTDET